MTGATGGALHHEFTPTQPGPDLNQWTGQKFMPNPYGDGTFIWHWYEWGFPIVVSAIALAITVGIFLTTDRKSYGVIARTLAVLAFIGTIPLAEERIGIGISGTKEGMAMINLLGGVGSGLLGAVHFLVYGKRRQPGVTAVDMETSGDPVLAGSDEQVPTTQSPLEPGAQEVDSRPVQTERRGDMTIVPDPTDVNTPSEPLAPPAWLVFQTGPNAGQTIPIKSTGTRIGRDPDNDIVIEDEGVSRKHLEVTFVDGGYRLTDVGSAGGTLVEGSPADAMAALESGTTVRLGSTDVLFMQGETQVPASGNVGSGDSSETLVPRTTKPVTMMAWLAVIDGPAKGQTCQINVGATTIGRGEDNDLVMLDSGISRNHALVVADDDTMTLFDLASAGSTELNGEKLKPVELSTTSVIRIGETELMLVNVDPGESSTHDLTANTNDETIVAAPITPSNGGVLVVQSGPDAGKTFQLTEGDNVIGRSGAAILLTDQMVSRRHAMIRKTSDSFIIYDLGSTAGTSVDGQEIKGDVVKSGDKIVLGSSTIVVMDPLAGQS